MKLSDIVLSAIFHVCFVASAMYGLSFNQKAKEKMADTEPLFFEVLEESEIVTASESEVLPQEKELLEEPQELNLEDMILADYEHIIDDSVLESVFIPRKDEEEAKIEVATPPVLESSLLEFDFEPDSMPDSVPASDKKQNVMSELQNEHLSEAKEIDESSIVTANKEQSKIVSNPTALNRILPIYPRSARRRGREGSVTLQVTVSELGEVSDTEVVVSSGHRELDSAAESAVRSARFVPASEDGVNIQGMVRLTFDFKLK